MDEMRDIACNTIDQQSHDLHLLSQSIWNMPELGFNEFHAHSVLTAFLQNAGFQVEKAFKLNTAFRATYKPKNSRGGPNLAVLCEYDALPGIGHACGHNLIAEIGVATALGVKAAMITNMDTKSFGTLTVIGCPAEEGLCGKEDLLQLGAFEGVDVAVMAHPSQTTLAKPNYVSMTPLSITYHGKAAHASSYPWEGLNALDAAVACYTNISHLRQQMKPTWRVHGVIKNGGAQPNIIPEETQLEYYLRTPTNSDMVILKQKVEDCVRAAALATGCQVAFSFGEKSYSNLISNNTLADMFVEKAVSLGVEFETNEEKIRKFGGSTDMGNVSHVIPSIHPKFYIGTTVSNHSKDFATAAGADTAQKYSLDIAKALALTMLELYNDDSLMDKVVQDFKKDVAFNS